MVLKGQLQCKDIELLGNSQEHLEKAGLLSGRSLILDEGTMVVIDAFKARVNNDGWPSARITVYPLGGKTCRCYVTLDAFDGVKWEPMGEVKVDRKRTPVKRITFDQNNYVRFDTLKSANRHEAIGYGDALSNGRYLLNAQKIKAEELAAKEIAFSIDMGVGSVAVVHDEKELRASYKVGCQADVSLGIEFEPGMMFAVPRKRDFSLLIDDVKVGSIELDPSATDAEFAEQVKKISVDFIKEKVGW